MIRCRHVSGQCKRSNPERCPKRAFRCEADDGHVYEMPRLASRDECRRSTRGFTRRASCAPFRTKRRTQTPHRKKGRYKKKGSRKSTHRMGDDMSVRGTPLKPCSKVGMTSTGFVRDGTCRSHAADAGSHHVCLKSIGSTDFCAATGQPDWCAGKDDWCVCEWAFDEAVRRRGCEAFTIDCDATNQRALAHYERAGKTAAAECIRKTCGLP